MMTITKKLLTAGATVAMLGMSLTGSAMATYDDGHNTWQNKDHSYDQKSDKWQKYNQGNDWMQYDEWFNQKGYQWKNDRNMDDDWNDYLNWSKNKKGWDGTEDWKKDDFKNWHMDHMKKMHDDNDKNKDHQRDCGHK